MARWYVETTTISLLRVGRPMMALYADDSPTTINEIIIVFDLGTSPIVVVVPRGEIESLMNPVNVNVMGQIAITPRSLFHHSTSIDLAGQRVIAPKSKAIDNDVNLLLYGSLQARQGIPG
ncbi:hypothetical protein GW17_00045488 [Ensete ventricosum]|nr:hypothetical protein GW17_00045488 [Ensete ventricosum]